MVPNIDKPNAKRASAAVPGLPSQFRARRTLYSENQEPALVDLLTDPIMQRLMKSDGVKRDQLIDLIADVKVRLNRRVEAA